METYFNHKLTIYNKGLPNYNLDFIKQLRETFLMS